LRKEIKMKSKYVVKNFTGALFKNEKKTTEKQPDFQGNVSINNVTYRLSAWKKTGQKGTFLSLAVSEFKPAEKAGAGDLGF
jgi:hypothetical protein